MKREKVGVSGWVNSWLGEHRSEQFKHGKWRFWFPTVTITQIGIMIFTIKLFATDYWILAVLSLTGVLIIWLTVGFLHYTDSPDKQIRKRVSAIETGAMFFGFAHFALIFYVWSHLVALQGGLLHYEQQVQKYNGDVKESRSQLVEIEKLRKEQSDNAVKQTNAQERIARLTADTIYWGGAKAAKNNMPRVGTIGQTPLLDHPVEALEKPKLTIEELPEHFFSRWDTTLRWLQALELLLVGSALAFIRNRSARSNTDEVDSSQLQVRGQSTSPSRGGLVAGFARGITHTEDSGASKKMENDAVPK